MPPDSNSNAPASAKTSPTPDRPSSKPTTPLTEAELLTRQARDAKAAVARTARELQHELLRTADPRAWMLVHPWATLSAALVAGFAAASTAIPSKEQQALKRLSALEAALNAEHKPEPQNGKAHDKTPSPMSKMTSILLQMAQPILASGLAALTSQLTKPQPPAPTDGSNGTPPPSPQDPSI